MNLGRGKESRHSRNRQKGAACFSRGKKKKREKREKGGGDIVNEQEKTDKDVNNSATPLHQGPTRSGQKIVERGRKKRKAPILRNRGGCCSGGERGMGGKR